MNTPVVVFNASDELVMLARLGVALACGVVLGLERRRRMYHPAGIRTMALITGGSAVFMLVSQFAFDESSDPGRVAAQVVTGVGFLGAGVMIFSRGRIRNLTTAASIWIAAGVGLAAGAGLFVLAGATTISMAIILYVIRPRPTSRLDENDENDLLVASI